MDEKKHRAFVEMNRIKLHQEFSNPETTPLDSLTLVEFDGLNYFEPDYNYLVVGEFEQNISDTFRMKTSTERLPLYRKYGVIRFELEGTSYELTAYQNMKYAESDEYDNELFIPFKDHSNGITSYGGGRYIDIKIPEGKIVELDFNLSYNPYCAYNDRYSCPIPPEENHLETEIKAGVKKYHEDH